MDPAIYNPEEIKNAAKREFAEWLYVVLEEVFFLDARHKEALVCHLLMGKSLNETGKLMGLTGERVRQLVHKSIAKLKERYTAARYARAMNAQLQQENRRLWDKLRQMQDILSIDEQERIQRGKEILLPHPSGNMIPPADFPVNDLGLSGRAKNTLLKEGINTVADLMEYRKTDLLKLRNMGKITLNEIDRVMSQLNIRHIV